MNLKYGLSLENRKIKGQNRSFFWSISKFIRMKIKIIRFILRWKPQEGLKDKSVYHIPSKAAKLPYKNRN